jgi:hypothetical protein
MNALYTVPPLRMARLRFELRPRTSFRLPPWRVGEVLYGAFGTVLRRTVCDAGCEDAEACPRRAECVYARLFEPAPIGPRFGETGGRKAFLFRTAADRDGVEISPRHPLMFEIRLFGDAIDSHAVFVDAFRRLAATGLADRAVDLISVLSLDWKGTSARILFESDRMTDGEPIRLDFRPFMELQSPGDRIRVEFVTPAAIKDRRRRLRVPSLAAIVRRLRDRISMLSLLWEHREWAAQYKEIGEVSERAVTNRFAGAWSVHERHSTRTRRVMPVEGFRGSVFYESVDPRLWSLLRIGEEIHVGQHVVWGNGQYRLAPWQGVESGAVDA